MQRRARGAIVLQAVEGWFSAFVKRHDLAVDDGFIREVGQRLDDPGIPRVEIVIVARPQMYLASRLYRQSSVSVELQFIEPLRSFGQPLSSQKQHRRDEAGCVVGAGHLGNEIIPKNGWLPQASPLSCGNVSPMSSCRRS